MSQTAAREGKTRNLDIAIQQMPRIVEMRIGQRGLIVVCGSCATLTPSSVAEAEMKDLNPFIYLVSFLMNQCSCSIMLFRYLTCNTSISQNQPSNNSRQFMFCNLARFAPNFRWLCNSRPTYLSLRCKIGPSVRIQLSSVSACLLPSRSTAHILRPISSGSHAPL